LQALSVWPSVEKQVARTENVRAALALVARGEAPFGIVYVTDALAEPHVRIVDTFPEGTHSEILYPIAIVASSRSPAAKAFIDHLRSVPARAVWERHGFSMVR
jgi:molybdate transport system substrate-binding protein